MFKGFQDTSRGAQFTGFPNLNHQMNNEAFGFSGCTFWLDAAFGLNTQTDLAAVTKWVDRIRGLDFSQATAGNQPRLVVSDAAFNNKPVIEFQSTARFLQTIKTLSIPKEFAIAVIYKVSSFTTQNNLLCEDNVQGTANRISLGGTATGYSGFGVYSGNGGTPSASLAANVEDTAAHIAILKPSQIVMDGVQNVTGSCQLTSNLNTIGGGSNQGPMAKIAEILVFARQFSDSDCIRLSGNINSKYAIY